MHACLLGPCWHSSLMFCWCGSCRASLGVLASPHSVAWQCFGVSVFLIIVSLRFASFLLLCRIVSTSALQSKPLSMQPYLQLCPQTFPQSFCHTLSS